MIRTVVSAVHTHSLFHENRVKGILRDILFFYLEKKSLGKVRSRDA